MFISKINLKNQLLFLCGFFIINNSLVSAQNNFNLYHKHKINSIIQKEKNVPDFQNYDVLKYNIELEIEPNVLLLEGHVSVVFEVSTNNLYDLVLNFSGLQIDSIKHKNVQASFSRQSNQLHIILNQGLILGEIDSVTIYYRGKPIRGMYFRDGKYNNRVVYTHNEPFDAQYWLPCKDIPSDKALLDLMITVPKSFKTVSNGLLIDTVSVGQDKMIYNWKAIYPISTYLISIAASEYSIVENNFNWNLVDLPLVYYVYPQDFLKGESALINTIEMLDFFSNYIGTYPFLLEKYGMVEVPFQEAAAMENQTITTMDEPVIDNESVIAHELAHQWWGDALTPFEFTDIWLNEGFATYFDALFVEHKYGADAFKKRMISSKSQISSDGSADFPIYNPPLNYLFGSAVYNKGAWVLHMLRNKLGDQIFKTIIRNYYSNFNYGNVTTLDFISLCENLSGMNLSSYFNQWVYSAGIPNLFLSWSQNNGIVNIEIDQLQDETIYQLTLDVTLRGELGDTTFTVDLNSKNSKFKISYSKPISQILLDPDSKVLNINNSPVFIIPNKTELISTFPNPFNKELNIFYRVNKVQNIKIEIWDILGRKLFTIENKRQQIGTHRFRWGNFDLASGTYFCILRFEAGIDKKKVLLIK